MSRCVKSSIKNWVDCRYPRARQKAPVSKFWGVMLNLPQLKRGFPSPHLLAAFSLYLISEQLAQSAVRSPRSTIPRPHGWLSIGTRDRTKTHLHRACLGGLSRTRQSGKQSASMFICRQTIRTRARIAIRSFMICTGTGRLLSRVQRYAVIRPRDSGWSVASDDYGVPKWWADDLLQRFL